MKTDLHPILIQLFLFLSKQVFCATDSTYKAAVVEYYPVQDYSLTPDERTNANVDRYKELIYQLEDNDFDILIYPESTITTGQIETRKNLLLLATVVPEIADEAIPCDLDDYPDFFRKLSCLAEELQTYLVVNLMEKKFCSASDLPANEKCAKDNWTMYNTDVVFDRTGKVIQKYRKYNLFGEPGMNVTVEAEVSTFDTDFGVTFGMFTCFDILFEKPALQLVRNGVKHIIFPTMWFSELPFLTALQAQNMFAVENDVVFLAAGANRANVGSGGSGIYQGSLGPIVYDIISNDGSKVYVADVMKDWNESTNLKLEDRVATDENTIDTLGLQMDNFSLKTDHLSYYNYIPVNVAEFDDILSHNEINCHISWKLDFKGSARDYYKYAIFYYSGVRSFSGVAKGGIDVCGLVFCQNLTAEEENGFVCGDRFPSYSNLDWPYTFKELTISANFTVSTSKVQYPNVLLSSIRPLDRSDYKWSSRYFNNDQIVEKTLTLLKPQTRLLTFAIYGRDFARDSANINLVNLGVLMFVLLPFLLRFNL